MSKKKKLILIIEDDEMIRYSLKTLLEDEGYRVIITKDGEEALEFLAKEKPNLILLDLMMPYMDGFEFRKKQKERNLSFNVPVIIMSAKGSEINISAIEAKSFLAKPFDIETLTKTVKITLALQETLV